MTIQIPYRGIIEIVGDHDVGKTIAALQTSNNMRDIIFIDDDVKGDGTVRQMKDAGIEFDDYISLAPLRLALGQTPTADELLQEVVLPTIDKIKSKKRKIIVWDTWRIVYQSARQHVERNQAKYASVVKFQGNSTIIQGLISRVARMIEVKQLNELKAVSELLVITHHVKDKYESNVLVGKTPESSTTFDEVCNMRMWLRRNQFSKVPVVLFLKRPNVPQVVKGKLQFVNIVPLKITPTNKHESIWDAIHEYEVNPIQSRMPTENETPSADELMAISGTLSPEMRKFVQASIEYNLKIEKELGEAVSEQYEIKPEDIAIKAPSNSRPASDVPANGIQLISMAKAQLGYELKDIEDILEMPFAQINQNYDTSHWDDLVKAHDNEISDAVAGKKKVKK